MRRELVAVLTVAAVSAGGSVVAGSVAGADRAADRYGTTRAGSAGSEEHARGGRHVATMRLGDGRTVGSVRFQRDRDGTRVSVSLRVPPDLAAAGGSFHGFHVHANDDPANGSGCVADGDAARSTWFVSADGHYSDPAAPHGQHSGDLPVVYLQADGESRAVFVTDRFRPEDVAGRAVIVHAKPDNYGNIPLGEAPTAYEPVDREAALGLTERTGNAGDRLACGVVGP